MTARLPDARSRAASLWVAQALRSALDPAGSDVRATLEPFDDWDLIGPTVARHRVAGILAPLLARTGAPTDAADRIRSQHLRATSDGLRVAHDTVCASEALRTAGIDHLIVKGVPLAAITRNDIASRGPGDVDVWVKPKDIPAAEAALQSQGWTRRRDVQSFPRPENKIRWRWLLFEMNEFPMSHASRVDVDLHWRLGHSDAELSFGFDDAVRSAVRVEVGAARIATLSPIHALEHLAQHARKEAWPNLRSVVDVVELCDIADADRVRDLADRNRNVRIAVSLASRLDSRLAALAELGPVEQRIADEAWERCLGGRSWPLVQPTSRGWDGVRSWIDHNGWLWRSSPSQRVRWWFLVRGILRARVFFDRRRRPWEKGSASPH